MIFLAAIWGILLSKFLFDPMKTHLERKASGAPAQAARPEPAAAGAVKLCGRPVVWIFTAVLFGIVLLVLWNMHSSRMERTAAGSPQDSKKIYTLLETFALGTRDLPNFKIAIIDGGVKHTLTCAIYLAYSPKYSAGTPDFREELNQRMPQLREIVYRVLGSKTFEELQISNMDRLGEELTARMNEVLERGQIVDIEFSQYVAE